MPNKDIIELKVGDKFNKWTVINPRILNPNSKSRARYVLAKCECGIEKPINKTSLTLGRTKGCLSCRKLIGRHGESHTPMHNLWLSIKHRVTHHDNWAGRGIKMQESWFNSYESFRDYILDNLGERPKEASLDRINNDAHYEEGNIRWANDYTQANNKRNTRLFKFNGDLLTLREVSNYSDIPYKTIVRRLEHGWDLDRALNQPMR